MLNGIEMILFHGLVRLLVLNKVFLFYNGTEKFAEKENVRYNEDSLCLHNV